MTDAIKIGDFDITSLKMEDINGEKHIEREYTAYVEVPNFNWIDDAPQMELHEQWNIGLKDDSVRQRIRLINKRRYTMAVKQPLRGEAGYYECEQDISADMFELLKLGGEQGFLKERFNFPIDGTNLKWEVDVFKSRAGGRHPWVKVDLEYHSINDPIPDFPFPIKGYPIIIDADSSPEVKAAVKQLWDEEWLPLDKKSARGV